MITVTTDESAERVVARFSAFTPSLRQRLRQTLSSEAATLQNFIIDEVSGPVLRNRTGTLRRSITILGPTETPDAIEVKVAVGKEAWYGKLHEYGGTFRRPVSGSARSAARSKAPGGYGTVTFPKRAFMVPALADRGPSIIAALRVAVEAEARA